MTIPTDLDLTHSCEMTTLRRYVYQYVGERVRRGEIVELTARNFRNHLLSFADSFGQRPLEQLGRRAVERWLEAMESSNVAPATRAVRMSTLRGFARWCVRNDIVRKDWTMDAPKVRRPRQAPRDMTNDHAGAVLAQARTERERLIVLLMFGAGLRCVEVSRLDVPDYDAVSHNIFVTGKAGHQREVPAPDYLHRAILAYLTNTDERFGPMVQRVDGGRLGSARISGIVNHLVKLSGVKVRLYDGRSAHGLRSAAASDLYEASANDPVVVQHFLGHANLQTTSIYLRRPTIERVRSAQSNRAALPPPGMAA